MKPAPPSSATSNNGISIEAGAINTVIGGFVPAARNVISGNINDGILISSSANTVIRGNFIGTDRTGTADLGNAGKGIMLRDQAAGNVIGGTTPGTGNVISGNGETGVWLQGSGTTGNLIQGNRIGNIRQRSGTIGNDHYGIFVGLGACSNTIGGTRAGAGNVIAHSGMHGVALGSGNGNAIQRNRIFANEFLGIDLEADGITNNDIDDVDSGQQPTQLSGFSKAPGGDKRTSPDRLDQHPAKRDDLHRSFRNPDPRPRRPLRGLPLYRSRGRADASTPPRRTSASFSPSTESWPATTSPPPPPIASAIRQNSRRDFSLSDQQTPDNSIPPTTGIISCAVNFPVTMPALHPGYQQAPPPTPARRSKLTMRRISGCLAILLIAALLAPAADVAHPAPPPRAVVPPSATPKMPLTGLAPAKPMFDACVYRYGVGTASPECQAFLNQALGMYYSYVWIEAARAAETAVTHDPECAYAWLILHRSLEKWGRGSATPKTAALAGALGATGFATLPATGSPSLPTTPRSRRPAS